MQALLRLSRIIDAIMQRLGMLAYWLVPLMVLVGVYNVFGRFADEYVAVRLSSNVLLELQWYLFSMVFFLGAPYALLHNEHVRVDVIYGRMSGRRRAWVNLLGALLFLIPFCIFLIWFSLSFVENSWAILEDSPDPGGLPRYPIKTMIPIGAGILAIQGISEAIKNAARLMGVLPLEGEEPEHQIEEQAADFVPPDHEDEVSPPTGQEDEPHSQEAEAQPAQGQPQEQEDRP